MNSAVFSRLVSVENVRDALVLLGEFEIRRWVTLAALPALASDKPHDLVGLAIVRARFLESIAPGIGLGPRSEALCLMGMFSLLDAIVGRPLEELMEPLGISSDILQAMLGRPGAETTLSDAYALAIAFERADWTLVNRLCLSLSANEQELSTRHIEAMRWAAAIFAPERVPSSGKR